ncbi:MAG: hypothetical protein NTY98_14060 [Verrucomicrobia bacterium]|nr:hypothetical protein [Verrucomicrobiota bacterium]
MSHDQSDAAFPGGVKTSPVSILIAMISCLGILLGIWYSWEECLHGEIVPQTASLLFAPVVWIASRLPLVDHRLHRFALASALCCFGLGWFVYLTGIRMGYMDWIIARGAVQNPHSHSLLLGYLGFSLLVCTLAVCYPFKASNTLEPC